MTAKQVENKERFLELLYSISSDRMSDEEKGRLHNWLIKSDFFTAPASVKYHNAYEGGLCEHSLNVYNILKQLVQTQLPYKVNEETGEEVPYYSNDTCILVGLFHDISKANYYEKYQRNVKDESGKWVQVEEYRVKSPEDRFIYANHESTSEFMLRSFVKLTIEESTAILHHHGGMGYDSSQVDMTMIFNHSGLTLLLHLADMIATYITENNKYNEN